jgi:hypothetical protein
MVHFGARQATHRRGVEEALCHARRHDLQDGVTAIRLDADAERLKLRIVAGAYKLAQSLALGLEVALVPAARPAGPVEPLLDLIVALALGIEVGAQARDGLQSMMTFAIPPPLRT